MRKMVRVMKLSSIKSLKSDHNQLLSELVKVLGIGRTKTP